MHPTAPPSCRLLPTLPRRVMSVLGASLLSALAAMATMNAQARDTSDWPDTYLSRLQAQALIQTANAEILGSSSATLTLEKWCRDHRLAADPVVIATLIQGVDKAPTSEQRQRLQIGPDEPVRYRRVQLSCGALVLSEADNWYVPSRLSAEMNRLLDTTDTPFGKAVLELKPFRRTYAATLLWSPLPPLWEMLSTRPQAGAGADVAKGAKLLLPAALFEHRALVFGQDLRPIAEVIETYQKGLLAFPAPAR
jgi:chorismate-pyruvate lyase